MRQWTVKCLTSFLMEYTSWLHLYCARAEEGGCNPHATAASSCKVHACVGIEWHYHWYCRGWITQGLLSTAYHTWTWVCWRSRGSWRRSVCRADRALLCIWLCTGTIILIVYSELLYWHCKYNGELCSFRHRRCSSCVCLLRREKIADDRIHESLWSKWEVRIHNHTSCLQSA